VRDEALFVKLHAAAQPQILAEYDDIPNLAGKSIPFRRATSAKRGATRNFLRPGLYPFALFRTLTL
jgi:hypothetical protein